MRLNLVRGRHDVLSTGGARFVAASNRDVQATEADTIAFNLLKGSGFRLRNVAKSLLVVPALDDDNSWSRAFSRSSNQLLAEAGLAKSAIAAVRDGKPVDRREVSVHLAQ